MVLNAGEWQAKLSNGQQFRGYYSALLVREGDAVKTMPRPLRLSDPGRGETGLEASGSPRSRRGSSFPRTYHGKKPRRPWRGFLPIQTRGTYFAPIRGRTYRGRTMLGAAPVQHIA
jgi:hypothetical protein